MKKNDLLLILSVMLVAWGGYQIYKSSTKKQPIVVEHDDSNTQNESVSSTENESTQSTTTMTAHQEAVVSDQPQKSVTSQSEKPLVVVTSKGAVAQYSEQQKKNFLKANRVFQ